MSVDKDIRFSDKKIDESWKAQAVNEKEKVAPSSPGKKPAVASSTPFMNLLSSLGVQAMLHLGEMPDPMTGKAEVNLEAAREIIDLLTALREKTQGNTSAGESNLLGSLIPELQIKFSQKA